MSEIVKYESLKDKLITVDNQLVLLDKDVSLLYGINDPRKLKQQLKRNIDKFPKEYAYQVSDEVVEELVSQNVIPSKSSLGGHNPWVFTEKGLYMVATILKSPKATEATFAIIEIFAAIRELSRNITALAESTDKEKQMELSQRTSEILEDIIDVDIDETHADGNIVETETRFEFNLGFVKVSKSTKRKKE